MDEKLETFTEKLIELGDKLVEAAEPGARVALETTLTAIWLEGFFSVAIGVAMSIGACFGAVYARKLALICINENSDLGIPYFVGALARGMLSMFAIIVASVRLLQTKHYIAIASPEAALALRIIGS